MKAHESEEVAVKERQRINHSKSQPENGGQSGDKRQECRTTLSNGSDKGKYDELRDTCESEDEEEIPNESYRMQYIIYRSIVLKKLRMPPDLGLAQREEKFKVTPLALKETMVSQMKCT